MAVVKLQKRFFKEVKSWNLPSVGRSFLGVIGVKDHLIYSPAQQFLQILIDSTVRKIKNQRLYVIDIITS